MIVNDFYIYFLHSTHSYELIFESSLDLCGWNTALSSSRCLAGENNKSDILLPEMVVTDFFKFSLHSTHSYELIFESSLDLCGWNTALSSSRCLAGDNNKSVILLPEMVVTWFFIYTFLHSTHSFELIFESSLDLCGWNTALSSNRCLAGDNNKSVILLPEMVVTDFLIFFLHSTHSFELIFESSLGLCGWNTALSSSRCFAGDNNKSVILLPEMIVNDFYIYFLHSTHSYELIFESCLDLCGWNTALSSSRCLAGDNKKSVISLPEMVVTDFLIFFLHSTHSFELIFESCLDLCG